MQMFVSVCFSPVLPFVAAYSFWKTCILMQTLFQSTVLFWYPCFIQGFRLCGSLFIASGDFADSHSCMCHVGAIADVLLLCLVLALGLCHRRQTNQAEFVASVMQPPSCIYVMVLFTNMAHVKIRAHALINHLSSFRVILNSGRLSPWGLSHRRRGTVPLLCPIHCRQYVQYQMTFLAPRLGHLSTLG